MGLTPLMPPEVRFSDPTDRYDHGVLGDAIEWGAMERIGQGGDVVFRLKLPPERVFEDLAPRLARLDPGKADELVVVESHRDLGAQLAIYRFDDLTIRKVTATPHIGRRNRWLAPAAIADFDGDGVIDIAYVETPHLAGVLKIVTLRGDRLVASVSPRAGFSNHRIGQDFITSGMRVCGGVAELLLPDLHWTTLKVARVENGRILARALPFPPSPEGIDAAIAECEG